MRKITPEDLFNLHLVGDVEIHPIKDQVIYVDKVACRESNDYQSRLVSVTPGHDPIVYTKGTTDDTPRFSPDGRHLAFLSKRSGQSQVWLMPTDGGEARACTRIEGGVKEFIWHPDSKHLILIAHIGPEGLKPEINEQEESDLYRKFNQDVKVISELAHKMDGVGYYTEKRKHVVIQSIEDHAEPSQLTRGPFQHHGLSVSPDGSKLVVISRYGDDYDRESFKQTAYVLPLGEEDLSSAKPQPLAPDPYSVSAVAFYPDGQRVLLLADNADDLGYDNTGLFEASLDGKSFCPIARDWDRPFTDLSISDMPAPGSNPLTFSKDGSQVFALTSRNGTTQLARVDLQAGSVELLTDAPQVFYSFAINQSRTHAALATTSPMNPGRIMWLALDGAPSLTTLSDPNQAILKELSLSVPERFSARTPDGPALDGWVMKPQDFSAETRYPTLLEIHGGPMMMYAESFFFEFQWLASLGYGVVYGNPRGSQGYGRDFCLAIQKRWGDKDYRDVMAILDTAIDQNAWIDSDRLGVLGGSYGGYMTNWIVGHSDRFKAAVTMRSVVDWKAMVGTGDGGWHWIRRANDAWPWGEDDAWYREQSPITYVPNITTPLLIEHQEGDLRCPIEQAEILYTAMKYFDRAPVKFIRYPDEFHGMSRNGKPWHRIYRLNTYQEWFSTYLD